MSDTQILHGDSLELFSTLNSSSVDLIISDPPYNLGKDYGNNHDLKGFAEYLDFSRMWLSEAHRVLKPTGSIYVFMGVRFISYLYGIMDRDLRMFFNSWICWHYTQGIGKKIGFSPRHDDILLFNKSRKFTFNLDSVRVPQNIIGREIICGELIPAMYGTSRMFTIAMRIVRIIQPRNQKD